jgi:hypothetical protein
MYLKDAINQVLKLIDIHLKYNIIKWRKGRGGWQALQAAAVVLDREQADQRLCTD